MLEVIFVQRLADLVGTGELLVTRFWSPEDFDRPKFDLTIAPRSSLNGSLHTRLKSSWMELWVERNSEPLYKFDITDFHKVLTHLFL